MATYRIRDMGWFQERKKKHLNRLNLNLLDLSNKLNSRTFLQDLHVPEKKVVSFKILKQKPATKTRDTKTRTPTLLTYLPAANKSCLGHVV